MNNVNFHLILTPTKPQAGKRIDLLHRIIFHIKNKKHLCKFTAPKQIPLHFAMLEKEKGHKTKSL